MLSQVQSRISDWIIRLFVVAIRAIQSPDRKIEVLNWLSTARRVVASPASTSEKFVELYRGLDAKAAVAAVFSSVAGAASRYAKSDLPLAAKLAVPATVLAMPFVSSQGAGIAAFGTAIGLPVLLLIFVGTAGITAIIESCTTNETARAYTRFVLDRIAQDEAFRAFRAAMRRGEQGEPEQPMRADIPSGEEARRAALLAMNPIAFEKHVMSFFVGPDIVETAATQQNGDKGIDGFAKHRDGLIVVQCKRYAPDNRVGGPAIMNFSGAMLFHEAWRGYFVTTSGFTSQAREVAQKRSDIVLVDMDEFVRWPELPPSFE